MIEIMQKLLLLLVFPFIYLSCHRSGNDGGEPVARVYNNYLYRDELAGILPANASSADSTKIAHSYIEKWVRNQLLLRLAEANLPEEEKNLEKQIANYRASLLIYKYQQYLLGQKLDSLVTMREIEEYYEIHGRTILLDKPAIKGVFLKVPADAPGQGQLIEMFTGSGNIEDLESYGNRYASRSLIFTETWMYADELLQHFPAGSAAQTNALRGPGQVTASDENFYYFLGVIDFVPRGSQMPLSIAARKIKNIIINRRKNQFLNELEKSLLNEGLEKNAIQYF